MRQVQFAVEDVALGDAGDALYVHRRQHLPVENDVANVGEVAGQHVYNRVAERLALVVRPLPVGQFVRGVLHEAGHDVLAGRGHVGVNHRGENDIHVGLAREVAILGVVVGAFDVVEVGADGDSPGQMAADARPAAQLRQPVEGQVDLARRAERLEAAHRSHQVIRQLRRVNQAQEGLLGVEAGEDERSANLVAVVQHDAGSPAVAGQNAGDAGVAADFGPLGLGGAGQYVGQPARAPLVEAPGAVSAVDLAHVVVQQDVGRARRARAKKGADDAAGGEGGL